MHCCVVISNHVTWVSILCVTLQLSVKIRLFVCSTRIITLEMATAHNEDRGYHNDYVT